MQPADMVKEQEEEDWCFVCKDGGDLMLCDYKNCPKVYHASCVKDLIEEKNNEESLICPHHRCYICTKRPKLYCLCCPHPVCDGCITHAEFIRIKENKGLCNQCLELVFVVEEIQEYNAAADKIDLKDRNTVEGLFLEYWEIIKNQEDLTFYDVQTAKSRKKTAKLKRKDKNLKGSSSYTSRSRKRDDPMFSLSDDVEEECRIVRGTKKMEFIGWGSKPLIDFLTSIGEDTKEAMSQFTVESVIKRYIRQKNLVEVEKKNNKKKKKKFRCDEKLYAIFKKDFVDQKRIYRLLNPHFKENLDQLEYVTRLERGFGVNDEKEEKEEKVLVSCKKQKVEVLSEEQSCEEEEEEEEVKQMRGTGLAAINVDNIKLVYLRRSLVVELLKEKESFEAKVLGSFVKMKNSPLESLRYQVLQVTGVTANDQNDGVLLYLAGMAYGVSVSKLDDNDITKEEVEDLKQKVMKGLLRQPTVAEMERKLKVLHEDITKHWIARELEFLQRRIDCANEKGKRREMEEYLDQREALQKPSEQERLIKKVPKIIEDLDDFKREVAVSSDNSSKQGNISRLSQEAVIEID